MGGKGERMGKGWRCLLVERPMCCIQKKTPISELLIVFYNI